jgi:NADPH-dependent 2,4-dienoyl-CoA reductase/sulfur reductase-like enzyme
MRESGFGGSIAILGDEASRPYERPPLSKAVLTDKASVVPWLSQETRYRDNGIELVLGVWVEAVEPASNSVRLADGRAIGYDQLLFATGGRARRLDIPGGHHIHYLRNYADALAIRTAFGSARRLVCIGAGVIGLEIASSAHALGLAVTVVEAGNVVLGRCLAPAEGQFVRDLHQAAGVELRLESEIVAIETSQSGKHVLLGDGQVLDADCVVAGIGMVRNTELASAAGLAVENGIVVDERGHTSAAQVFAAGDVAAFFHPLLKRRMRLESFYHAQDHGMAVGRAMAGMDGRYEDIPRFWTDQHGVNLQVAGSPTDAARTVVRGSRETGRFTAIHLDTDGRVIGVCAANNAREMRPALDMIRRGVQPDTDALADTQIPLNKIAA